MATGTNTATWLTTYKDPSGDVTIKESTVTADSMFDYEVTGIAASGTYTIATGLITLSLVKSLAMGIAKTSGQASNLTALATVNVNDDGSPDKVIHLTATNGIGWSYGDTHALTTFVGTVDIDTLYVHNTGTGLIDFFFRGLIASGS